MIIERHAIRLAAALLAFVLTPAAAETFRIGYLQRAEDPFYAPHRGYTGLSLRDRHRPHSGAETALRDARVIGRALELSFELVRRSLAGEEPLLAAVEDLLAAGVRVFLLDLPLADVIALGTALADSEVVLFNIRHRDDRLRGEACSPVLYHTLPSRSMETDALAQHLLKKGWRKVLMLRGETADDTAESEAFRRSARKLGLKIADERPFALTRDPRRRDQSNVVLLTSGVDYDAVFLADSLGEFGRYVPFDTRKPRPVIGAEGLSASAWHWTWERHGAPQLNQRFVRIAKRHMQSPDYAAWAAVRAVIEALVRTGSIEIAALRRYLTSDILTLDIYKGAPGGFRPWDNQLRQGILLHTHNAVTALAPLDGFLHQRNNLDTLGADAPESRCRS